MRHLHDSTRSGYARSGLLLALLLCAGSAHSLPVDDFMLLDHQGNAHKLYYYSDAKAIVIMVQGNGCPIVRSAWPDFNAARAAYEPRGVRFWMINSNLQDDRDSIAREAAERGYDLPILDDESQLVGESLNLIRTGEVLVIDPATWEIVYRGPMHDRLTFERQKAAATHHYLTDVLDALLAGDRPAVSQRNAVGCLINFPARNRHAAISYSETVAPILRDNCSHCHRPGGIGPWAMTGYDMVRGFAPMIREVLRTKRMPPWHADPHIGRWEGDRSLATDDLRTLVHWIEDGAPRGTGPDPLEAVGPQSNEWPLGEPDLIVNVPAFDIPATGVVDYQFPAVDNPLERDVWVRAAAVIPGDREVVHHVLVGSSDPGTEVQTDTESVFDNYIIGYAPGNETLHMPEGTGVFVPAGGKFMFQMHYTPVGRATRDETRLGLYFHDEPPANFLRNQVVLNPRIRIPPHAAAHEEAAYYQFDKPAILYNILPHAHYRGRSSRFEVVYPDGRVETLLSVPNYDFNWQRTYAFADPPTLPAGSRLVHRTVYDNSRQNPGNPDPERTVPWGLQSWDEMLYGAFSYAWVDETSAEPIHDKVAAEMTQLMGFLDRDMDGRLVWKELPERMQRRLLQSFKLADRNGDGGLNVDEFIALQRRPVSSR